MLLGEAIARDDHPRVCTKQVDTGVLRGAHGVTSDGYVTHLPTIPESDTVGDIVIVSVRDAEGVTSDGGVTELAATQYIDIRRGGATDAAVTCDHCSVSIDATIDTEERSTQVVHVASDHQTHNGSGIPHIIALKHLNADGLLGHVEGVSSDEVLAMSSSG